MSSISPATVDWRRKVACRCKRLWHALAHGVELLNAPPGPLPDVEPVTVCIKEGLVSRKHAPRARRASKSESPRVLIVDDEAAVRTFVERVLRSAGYAIAVAAGGPEALSIAATEGPFDLLLTDVMMPEMHGGELARQLRRQHANLEVLYLTGYGDRLFKEKTMWEGEAFLDKPCTVNGLLDAVALVLYRRALPPAC